MKPPFLETHDILTHSLQLTDILALIMFDVIWTDPDRELVGEHRARKEKKREQKLKQKERQDSIARRSQSVHSGGRPSSDHHHPFGFLLGRASKKKDKNSLRSNTASSSHRSSGQDAEEELVQPLGPASCVTKKTEVSSVPRTSGSGSQDLSSEVFISSEPDTDQPVTPPEEDG